MITAHLRLTFYGESPLVVERIPGQLFADELAVYGKPVSVTIPGLGTTAIGIRPRSGPRAAIHYDWGLTEDIACYQIGERLEAHIYLDWAVLVVDGYPTR